MTIRFDGRVAIVTGAGNGLGRAHALGLASRGAKVVVNDFGGARDGTGGSLTPAEAVVEEIKKAGGEAMSESKSIPMDTRGRVGWLVLGGVLAVAVARSFLVPEAGWDAFSHWGLRAQAHR